jgi:hypothetical protein
LSVDGAAVIFPIVALPLATAWYHKAPDGTRPDKLIRCSRVEAFAPATTKSDDGSGAAGGATQDNRQQAAKSTDCRSHSEGNLRIDGEFEKICRTTPHATGRLVHASRADP